MEREKTVSMTLPLRTAAQKNIRKRLAFGFSCRLPIVTVAINHSPFFA